MLKKHLHAAMLALLCSARITYVQAAPGQSHPNPVKVLSVDMGNGCAIQMTDHFKGHLASGMPANATYWTDKPPIPSTVDGGLRVDFTCTNLQSKSINDIAHQYGADYDQSKKKWVVYFGSDASQEDIEALRPVTKIWSLKSINARGFYWTQDETDGDPNRRERYMGYCLFDRNKGLCGNGHVMILVNPKGNLLPYALEILRSIEFIDSPSSTSVPHTAQP